MADAVLGIPHSSVDAKLFYTHLGSDMPEPIRARHMIAWTARRAADEETGKKSKTKGKERTSEGDRLINEIMEEVVMSLAKGNVDTNVFANIVSYLWNTGAIWLTCSRHLQAGIYGHIRGIRSIDRQRQRKKPLSTGVLQSVPSKWSRLKRVRCRKETSQWSSIVNATLRKRETVHKAAVVKRSTNEEPDVDGAGWMVDALDLADEILADGEGDLTKMGDFEDVEFKVGFTKRSPRSSLTKQVDSLLNSTHVAVQYSRQSQRFLDGIFASLTADLRARESTGLPRSLSINETDGPDAVAILSATTRAAASGSTSSRATTSASARKDPMDMLRALASADSKVQNEEAVAAAARVTPVIPQSTTGINVSVGQSVSATPRRVGQATPRRVQQSQAHSQPTPRSLGIGKRAELAE